MQLNKHEQPLDAVIITLLVLLPKPKFGLGNSYLVINKNTMY